MEDEGEAWAQHKAERREKRWSNVQSSLALLRGKGIEYETLNEKLAHYRIDGVSFWPSTGKYYDPKSGAKGRGVINLIKYLHGKRSLDNGRDGEVGR